VDTLWLQANISLRGLLYHDCRQFGLKIYKEPICSIQDLKCSISGLYKYSRPHTLIPSALKGTRIPKCLICKVHESQTIQYIALKIYLCLLLGSYVLDKDICRHDIQSFEEFHEFRVLVLRTYCLCSIFWPEWYQCDLHGEY
jgi:hypothetical protein